MKRATVIDVHYAGQLAEGLVGGSACHAEIDGRLRRVDELRGIVGIDSRPLGERLGHFYRSIGVTVLEGFGLTETTAASSVNRPESLRMGTVGIPLPGISMRTADDGELEVKGTYLAGKRTGHGVGRICVLRILHRGG